jgi:hypothetical protein
MTSLRYPLSLLLTLLLIGGCAMRPINPAIVQVDPSAGYRYLTRQEHLRYNDKQTMVILAFSGGGTRAADSLTASSRRCGALRSWGLKAIDRGDGPLIVATATDISTGRALTFEQSVLSYLCSNLAAVPLSRAAAASSAVPLALSAVTFNNYGGSFRFASEQRKARGRND